ncbi:alpha/beta hydrolase [Viridibacterium curvum]|uniref:Alpha/beta hydrolase n=1 Tax=Viridibacterium curvum TaxID=1101404 RepID=A0ABP9QVN1_9RHOO
MLFITNRFPKGSIQTRAGRKFEFDLKNNAPSNSVFFCRRNADGSLTEVGGMNFLSELKGSSYRQILLYIHGFSNLPDSVFEAAEEFQALCDQQDPNEVLVVPIIWPCDNDLGIVQDYWDDQKSADGSAYSLSRALSRFLEWRESNLNSPGTDPCLKRINVLAHSMGNRVLRETLCAWDRYDLADGVPLIFRNTFLVAADIENESIHRTERAKLICDASRNVVVYYASDDLALRASKAANLKNKIASRRLGHTGPENMDMTPKNVYVVDCDDVNNSYDVPKGHSYFRSGKVQGKPGLVFEHIYGCLKTGRVFPEDEQRRSTIIRES